MFPLPVIILNDGGESDCSQSRYCPPQYHQLVAAPQQDHDLQDPPKPSLLNRVGPLRPSAPDLAFAAAQKLRRRSDADGPRIHPSRGHPTPSWGLAPPFQNAPLGLQTPSPGGGSQPGLPPLFPELGLAASCPHDARWRNGTPLTSDSNSIFGLGPHVLVPVGGPPGFCCVLASPLCPRVLPPGFQPSWCMWPRAADHHRPPSHDLVARGPAPRCGERVDAAASGSEQLEGQAEPEGQRSRINAKVQGGDVSDVSLRSPPFLDEESLKQRAFEDYMAIMDSTCPQIPRDVRDKDKAEDEEAGRSFLELLDELSGNENFFRDVESALNPPFLDSILSPDPQPFHLLLCEDQEQEEPRLSAHVIFSPATDVASQAASTLNTEDLDPHPPSDEDPVFLVSSRELLQEIVNVLHGEDAAPLRNPQGPISDPPEPNRADGQGTPPRDTGPQDGRTWGSPLLRSWLLGEPTDASRLGPFLASLVASPQGSEAAPDLRAQGSQEAPRPGGPPASESPPHRAPPGNGDPAPGSSAGPPALSVLALRAVPRLLPPMREPRRPPQTINPVRPPEAAPVPSDAAARDARDSATEAREERLREHTSESEAEDEEKEDELEETTEGRLTLSGTESLLPPGGEPRTESAEEKKQSAKGVKQTEERRAVCGEAERRSSAGKWERDGASQAANEAEIEEEKLTGEMPKVAVEGGEQRDVIHPGVSPETGAESPSSTKSPPEEKGTGEGIQMSRFARRTRRLTSEDRLRPTPVLAVKARGKSKHSEAEGKSGRIRDGDRPGPNVAGAPSPAKRSRRGRAEEDGAETARDRGPPAASSPRKSTKASAREEPPGGRREPIEPTSNSAPSPGGTGPGGPERGGDGATTAAAAEDERERAGGAGPWRHSPTKRNRRPEGEASSGGREALSTGRRRGGRRSAFRFPAKYKDFVSCRRNASERWIRRREGQENEKKKMAH